MINLYGKDYAILYAHDNEYRIESLIIAIRVRAG